MENSRAEPRFREGVAIVVGGSGGIGRAVCEALARDGSNVALTYHRNQRCAAEVVAAIRSLGRQSTATPISLENAEEVKAFVDSTAVDFGRVHSVVYAAGPKIHMQFINELNPRQWASVFSDDVNGCFNLVWAVLPHLTAHHDGALVAIITGRRCPCIRRFRKPMNTLAPTPPLTTMKRSAPLGLIAEIMFNEKRCPVTRTTGVSPWGARVLPL